MVYVPTYNPATVYGAWQNAAYPPVYLPPTPGEQFSNSFVRGLGYSLGVATTYALFSAIDWDDDDDYHHHDHHDGYSHNGDNININVNNYNRITGENRPGNMIPWHHNPAYRNGIGYADNRVAAQSHSPSSATGLSTAQNPADRASQRQAAAGGFSAGDGPQRHAEHPAPCLQAVVAGKRAAQQLPRLRCEHTSRATPGKPYA